MRDDAIVVGWKASCSIAAQHDDLSAEARGAKADDVHARADSRRAWRSESGGSAVGRCVDRRLQPTAGGYGGGVRRNGMDDCDLDRVVARRRGAVGCRCMQPTSIEQPCTEGPLAGW